MPTVSHLIFFEKPGCGGNARQRALLEAAGHTLDRRSWKAASPHRRSPAAARRPEPAPEPDRAYPPIPTEPAMPLYDYHCKACAAEFELLVRAASVPICPQCGAAEPERITVSRLAPAGRIEAIRMSNRRAADAQGHFSNLAPGERARLLKQK
jgi:putative FmdB family regulatory protein